MAKRYATLDATALPAALELQQSGVVLTVDTDGASGNARATQTLTHGRWTWECAVFGTEELTATNCAFGLVQTTVANTARVGAVLGSVGFTPGDGNLWINGVNVATVSSIGMRQIIQFALDLIASPPTLQVIVNNLVLYAFSLQAGYSWIPAASIGVTTAYGLSAYVNFGVRVLYVAAPDGYKTGVYRNPQSSGSLFLSSAPYRSGNGDSPANQRFDARILNANQFSVESGVTFWTDGQSGSTWSGADLDLANADGALDGLLSDQPRDAMIAYSIVDLDRLDIPPRLVATACIDSIEQPDSVTIRIRQKSALARWDSPLPVKVIPPWADAGTANRPCPMAFGAVRNVNPQLIDENGGMPIYWIHDAPLTAIGVVRDRGDPFDPTTNPPDYTPTIDRQGIVLQTDPVGKLVADVSSSGNSQLTPITPTDLLGGVGMMTSGTGGLPTGWTDSTGTGHNGIVFSFSPTGGGFLNIAYNGYSFTPGGSGSSAVATSLPASLRAIAVFSSGAHYRLNFRVPYAGFSGNTSVVTPLMASLSLRLVDSSGITHVVPASSIVLSVGSFSINFVAPVNATEIDLRFQATADYSYHAYQSATIRINAMTLVQVAQTSIVADLAGIDLEQYFREIVELRQGETADAWSSADAMQIDTEKPYPFGVATTDQITTNAMLRAPLDSFGAAITQDEAGQARIVMLRDPESIAPAATITLANLQNYPLGVADTASGLTLSAGARHNWTSQTDSDFVDDYDPVTGIDASTRAKFKRTSQYVVIAHASMPDIYDFARGAAELPTLFDMPDDALAQIEEIADLYTVPRLNYSMTFFYSWPAPTLLQPGSVLRVVADRGPFRNGKNLYIKQLRHYPLACQYDILIGWG